MITGMWENIKLVCKEHGCALILMPPAGEYKSPYYACPKYLKENRTPIEKMCGNIIDLITAEKVVENVISQKEKGLNISLKGYKSKVKKGNKIYEFEVIRHTFVDGKEILYIAI